MQGRPSSSRPSTSARPTTAFDRDQFHHIQHHIQQQQPHEIEEESEEESDDEDVFAFLPPTTADQEQQSTSHSPFAFSPVPYPEPTFDPWGRQHPITPSPAPPLPPGIRGISSQTHPNPLPNSKPPISPPSPSTDSHPSTGMSGPDFYRLKRLGTAALSKLGVVDNTKEMKEKSDRNGIDITNIGEKKAETYPSDDSNLERDTSLHRLSPTIPPWKGVTDGVVSVLRERGTKNPNAMPYKMYSQQASSYYGRDVRTGTASASGATSQNARLSTAQSSSFQHTAGPSHSHSHSNLQSPSQSQYRQRQHHAGTGILGMPQAASSLADSLSMTQSMMEDGEGRSIKFDFDFDAIDEEDSPYPEVRASVSNIDDPDMPAMTIRMWFVGLLLCMTSTSLNVFFNFRDPAPTVVPIALLLISYPFGKFLAFTLPIRVYRIPLPHLPRFMLPLNPPSFAPFSHIVQFLLPLTCPRDIEFSLNPGPWNIKEHVLVYIMANVAVGNPYALNAIVVSEVYYHIVFGYWFSLTLVLATQLTGFGLAGLCRRFLVWPASMVWPQNLVACTLLNTLHAEDEDDGIGMYGGGPGEGTKGITRLRFFLITMSAAFFFFFLPGYLFQALSVFSYICWAQPTNIPVNQMFGVRTGMGMGILTFDWSQISWVGSPLMVPWWAEMHIFIGFVVFYWILAPILYYTNSWDLAYFPISSNEPFDRFGKTYNVTHVLLPNDTFNETAYNLYSPLYLSTTYAMTYLLSFALSTCALVHTALYHGKSLVNGLRMRVENDDIHAKLMRNYREVPEWWYFMVFCFFFCVAVIAVEVWGTEVPVWALLLSILLPIIYILPSGFIYAMTGQGININVIAQIIPGTLLPGKPFVNMIFKAYSVQTLAVGTSFVQDLKLGHYVKVPPRSTFMVQMVATILAAFIQVGVKEWIFNNVPNICQQNQVSQLTCPQNQVFYTASAVWGLIGPARQFGTGSVYHPHLYAIIAGVFIPMPAYFWQRRYPNSWARYVSTPVILAGLSYIPPATGINYSSWFLVGFIFQYLIRKKNFAWWSKFNYVLSSALDCGTVISIMVIFFTLQFPKGGTLQVNWWGNTIMTRNADWNRTALLTIPPDGIPWNRAG